MKVNTFRDFIGKWVEFTIETGDSFESIFMGESNDGYIFNDTTEGIDYAYFIPREKLIMMEATSEDNQDNKPKSYKVPTIEVTERLEPSMIGVSGISSSYTNKYRKQS